MNINNPEIHAFYKRMAGYYKSSMSYDVQYSPLGWLEGVGQDELGEVFARYVRFLFEEAGRGAFWEEEVGFFAGDFYYYAVERGLYLSEVSRDFPLVNALFLDCRSLLNRVGESERGPSRGEIELAIDAILTPHKVAKRYRDTKGIFNFLLDFTSSFRDRAAVDYLLRALKSTDDLGKIELIVKGLRYNRVRLDFAGGAGYVDTLVRYFSKGAGEQYSFLQYLQVLEIEQFKSFLKIAALESVYEENRAMLTVTRCRLESGEQGLVELFHNSDDDKVKIEILKCYNLFRTKKMASLAVEVMRGDYSEPVRKRAYTTFYCDPLVKFVGWFGDEAVDFANSYG